MRTLPPDLLAAQRSPNATPALRVTVRSQLAGVARTPYALVYRDPAGGAPHAAAVTPDGALVRARVAGGVLQVQRVPGPGAGSDFTSWTGLGPAAAVDPGVGTAGPNRVVIASVESNGTTVVVRESTDGGGTFGAASVALTGAVPVQHVAVAASFNGDLLLAYAAGNAVAVRRRVSGVWGAASPWPHAAAAVTGLAVAFLGDYVLFVTGADAGGAHVWALAYGAGFGVPADTWGPRVTLATASPGSPVTYERVGAAAYDTLRAGWVEQDAGSGAYRRLELSHQPNVSGSLEPWWQEPAPSQADPVTAPSLVRTAAGHWLVTGREVWLAPEQPALSIPQEDVLELAASEEEGGSLRLTLRNDHGRYHAGTPDGDRLAPGAQVDVEFGYVTAAGPQYGARPAYWLHSVTRSAGRGRGVVVLEGHDGWGRLAAWTARRQLQWDQGSANIFLIATAISARAGLPVLSDGTSPELTALEPAFTVYPGERGDVVLRRLLAAVPDRVRFDGGTLVLRNPSPAEPPSYAYGTDHPVLEATHRARAEPWNAVQVFGAGVLGEAFAHGSVAAGGLRLRQVHDLTLTTAAQAGSRAAALLSEAERAGGTHEVLVPVNTGQELYDVVTVSDPAAGLPTLTRRVAAITWLYRPERGQYRQRLRLELP